jgi:hypothetical protein
MFIYFFIKSVKTQQMKYVLSPSKVLCRSYFCYIMNTEVDVNLLNYTLQLHWTEC